MTVDEVMATLESLGTAQNRKVYARHSAPQNLFGVSFANLEKLRKQIKRDHVLACGLWNTGNFDARNLAMMIADPTAMSSKDLDAWVRDMDTYCLASVFARHIAGPSKYAREKAEKWAGSKEEIVGETGYLLLCWLTRSAQDLDDAYFEGWLAHIEQGIASAPNRVRNAMNNLVISIGLRNPHLQKLALAAAGRIGKVEVDHGETGCKTPDAIAYIRKAAAQTPAKKKAAAK